MAWTVVRTSSAPPLSPTSIPTVRERECVEQGPVVVAVEPVGPRMQERDAHELPGSGVRAHASALPQQFLAAVNERCAEHSPARYSSGAEVGHLVVEHSRSKAARAGRLDAMPCGINSHHKTMAAQKIAIGFSGEPVPPAILSGAATTRNSQRPACSHFAPRCSSCR